ncbi:hypothetical protein SAMN02745181_1905 [Rubritalea squalenifaciens DSM 18772]|uniref:Uncharacterized protein n=1 Tax=Rubritalea squalenifaciens DSM 18772 TaxID=1123071 RepID=A0A1M6ISV0_9BACT|nr:hypothetical protein [Rubritalea squalenifaciens]SHJ37487.1 hypothetical protein SAMN02745181_1905 [Rubritalea squalenifaciens DSM 18772]
MNIILKLIALGCFTSSVLAAPTSADSVQPEEKPRTLKLQIATVGPVKLARFGNVRKKPERPEAKAPVAAGEGTTQANAQTKEGQEINNAKAAGGKTEFQVLTDPSDEIPPNRVFVKTMEGKYEQIVCAYNSVSPPIEVPYTSDMLNLYTMLPPAPGDSEPKYKRMTSIPLPEGDRHLLLTITKPLKIKKWIDPIVSAHDLTNTKNGSLIVINTSDDQIIGCKIDDTKKALAKVRGRITHEPNGKKVAHVMMVSQRSLRDEDTKELLPFIDGYFRIKPDSKVLFLVYSVTPKESRKGAKYIRTTIDS